MKIAFIAAITLAGVFACTPQSHAADVSHEQCMQAAGILYQTATDRDAGSTEAKSTAKMEKAMRDSGMDLKKYPEYFYLIHAVYDDTSMGEMTPKAIFLHWTEKCKSVP